MHKLIPFIVFIDVVFLVMIFYYLIKEMKTRQKDRRLKEITSRGTNNSPTILLKREKPKSNLEKAIYAMVDSTLIESLLLSSGRPISLKQYVFVSLGTGLFFLIPVMLFLGNIFFMILFFTLGLLLPLFYLVYKRKKREQALVEQLPDALEMIVRALRIGQAVDGALKEVGSSFPPPVGIEIRKVYDEIAMGLAFESALRNFEKRFSTLPDVKILCSAFIIQRETGGNLTVILDSLAKTIRERFQLKRQAQALSAEGRSSSIILGILPVVFAGVTWLFNPEYISILFTHPLGKTLLIFAIILVAAGFVIMRIMSRIEI